MPHYSKSDYSARLRTILDDAGNFPALMVQLRPISQIAPRWVKESSRVYGENEPFVLIDVYRDFPDEQAVLLPTALPRTDSQQVSAWIRLENLEKLILNRKTFLSGLHSATADNQSPGKEDDHSKPEDDCLKVEDDVRDGDDVVGEEGDPWLTLTKD